MLLTLDWQVYSPFFYLHELENFRKDAVVIDIDQLRRSWYFDYLRRAYPETMKQAQGEADAFLEDLRAWESDPELYQREEVLDRRISQRYQDLIMALVGRHSRSAPVYVTQDIATYPEGGTESAWVRLVTGRYRYVPGGLVFRLYEDRLFAVSPARPALQLRGLNDGSLRFADDDVVKVKVMPVYANMLFNRGRYLATFDRHWEAIQGLSGSSCH